MGRERVSQEMLKEAHKLAFSTPIGETNHSAILPFRQVQHQVVTEAVTDAVLYRRRETTTSSRLGRLVTPPPTRVEVVSYAPGDTDYRGILRYFDLYYQNQELVGSLAIAAERRRVSGGETPDDFVFLSEIPPVFINDAITIMPDDFALPTKHD